MKVSPIESSQPRGAAGAAAEETAEWGDFRDHLSTADKKGHRRWIYPRKPCGRFYRARSYLSWLLLAILFGGPFVRIQGNPLLLFDIVDRRFSICGQIFWPQDGIVFAVGMLLFFTSILVFTSAFGRLWCGWTCPQTLLMEMVFRKIEFWIEGDGALQRRLAAAPWTAGKILRKTTKHALFLALSFLIGNTLLSYIIGTEKLWAIVSDDPRRHLVGLAFMGLFTGLFYVIFARFREQACIFICPYGRFQSTIVDDNTLVVAYDYKRGERRGHWQGREDAQDRRAAGMGDCVDCQLCVAVCPTGIDIRNGTQMECVSCTACIDACDSVMTKLGRPRGLIRYASLNSIEQGQRFRFTTRIWSYCGLLVVLAGILAFLVFGRSNVATTLLRAPGSLFQQTTSGKIENLYTLKAVNKTSRDIALEFKLENSRGTLSIMGGEEFIVPKEKLAQTSVLIELDPADLATPNMNLTIGVYADGRRIQTIETVFVGPRNHFP